MLKMLKERRKNVPKKFKNLIVEIEALHDEITGNYVLYTDEALSDFETWVSPYKKPAILHHKDEDGKIVGRVLEAKKIPSVLKPGLNALWLKARITDSEMIEGIKDGTYLTTSVGAKGNHVECSICGHRIDTGYACQHKKGKMYKDKLCYWIVKRMTAKEISFVIVPSDKYSQIVKFYDDESTAIVDDTSGQKGDGKKMELQEALDKIKVLEGEKAAYALKLQTAEDSLRESEEKLSEEIVLREGLEAEVQEIRLAEKQTTVASIIELREKLGMRQIDKETLETKSDIYLKEALADLSDELNFKEAASQEPPIEKEPEDITGLKESQKIVNTDVPLEKDTVRVEKKSAKSIVSNILG